MPEFTFSIPEERYVEKHSVRLDMRLSERGLDSLVLTNWVEDENGQVEFFILAAAGTPRGLRWLADFYDVDANQREELEQLLQRS